MKSFWTEQKTKSQEKFRTQQIILELNESKLWPKVFVGALLPKMKFWFISHKKYFCNANDCHYITCKIWIKTEVQMCTTGKILRPVCAQLNKKHKNKKNVKFKGPRHKAPDPYSFLDSWLALRRTDLCDSLGLWPLSLNGKAWPSGTQMNPSPRLGSSIPGPGIVVSGILVVIFTRLSWITLTLAPHQRSVFLGWPYQDQITPINIAPWITGTQSPSTVTR